MFNKSVFAKQKTKEKGSNELTVWETLTERVGSLTDWLDIEVEVEDDNKKCSVEIKF